MIRMILLAVCFSLVSLPLYAETVTLSTYYPAPFGSYDRIKLVPRDPLALDPDCNDDNDVGTMYQDNGSGERTEGLYVCQEISSGAFDWNLISSFSLQKDEKDKTQIKEPVISLQKVACIGDDGKMGICLDNPSADGTCACEQGGLETKEE